MSHTKKLLIVTVVGLALAGSAFAGDWGVSFSYGHGGYCRGYSAGYVYVDRSPVVYYNDCSPDVVVYDRPAVVYDAPVVYRSVPVVYRGYGPVAYRSSYYRSYAPAYRSYRGGYYHSYPHGGGHGSGGHGGHHR
jgi:hypothetical protein